MKTGFRIVGWLILIIILLVVLNLPKARKINNCEQHDFAVTSEYVFFLDKYKTVSKCINCGLVID